MPQTSVLRLFWVVWRKKILSYIIQFCSNMPVFHSFLHFNTMWPQVIFIYWSKWSVGFSPWHIQMRTAVAIWIPNWNIFFILKSWIGGCPGALHTSGCLLLLPLSLSVQNNQPGCILYVPHFTDMRALHVNGISQIPKVLQNTNLLTTGSFNPLYEKLLFPSAGEQSIYRDKICWDLQLCLLDFELVQRCAKSLLRKCLGKQLIWHIKKHVLMRDTIRSLKQGLCVSFVDYTVY